jgi:hypothetical protein
MAIAIDNANAGTAVNDAAATTIAVSTTATVAAGGFIVASIAWWAAAATLSSVSGGGLTWVIAKQAQHPTANPAAAIAYAQAPSGLASGTTITATYSTSVNGRAIGLTSFTGVATSSPLDTTSGPTSSTSTTAWATSSTTIAAGSVLVAYCHMDPFTTDTPTAPSIEALDWGDASNLSGATLYRIEAAGGAFTIAGTMAAAVSYVAVAAAFLASAGGGGGTVMPDLMMPPMR